MDDQEKQIPATENYTVKTTRDLKEKIAELQGKTGLNAKELFEAMVTTYELKNLEGTSAEQTEDMQVLRYHLNRAESIFLSLVEKNQDLKRDFAMKMEEENVKLTSSFIDFQKQKQDLTNRLQISEQEKSDIESRCFEISERNKELEADHKRTTTTIDLLQKHNDELEVQLTGQPELLARIEQLTQHINELSKYKDLLEAATQEHERAMESAKKDIEGLKQIHELEKAKAVLEAESRIKDDYTAKLDKVMERAEIRIQEADKRAQEVKDEYAARIKVPETKRRGAKNNSDEAETK